MLACAVFMSLRATASASSVEPCVLERACVGVTQHISQCGQCAVGCHVRSFMMYTLQTCSTFDFSHITVQLNTTFPISIARV